MINLSIKIVHIAKEIFLLES